jgi:pimeloyl-ACP methyl ester carboxylesterase
MPLVKAGDINMYYDSWGSGFPLVLLMGLACPGGLWLYQVGEFSQKYRVICPDNRGVGRSDKPAVDYSIEMFADDTANLLRALGIGKAHVLGMSMGGAIAQQMALRHPEMVEKLVLACTLSETSPYGERILDIWRRVAEGAGMDTLRTIVVTEALTPRFFTEHPEVVDEVERVFAQHPQPLDAYLRQNRAVARHRTTELLPRIKATTLVLSGDRDTATPVGAARIIARSIPNARQVVMPRLGHGFMWEAPHAFNQEVLSFLEE